MYIIIDLYQINYKNKKLEKIKKNLFFIFKYI